MSDRPRLRAVGPDERLPDKTGSIGTIVEDLETANGLLVETTAEGHELPGDPTELIVELNRAADAVGKALSVAYRVRGH